jgi:hypothetical protein
MSMNAVRIDEAVLSEVVQDTQDYGVFGADTDAASPVPKKGRRRGAGEF